MTTTTCRSRIAAEPPFHRLRTLLIVGKEILSILFVKLNYEEGGWVIKKSLFGVSDYWVRD